MNRAFRLAAILLLTTASGLAAQTRKAEQSKKPALAVVASPLGEDKGKLDILLDGKLVGTEDFEVSRAGRDWVARGTTRLESGRDSAQVSARLRLAADGTPLHYEWSATGPKKASAVVEFEGGVAKLTLQMEGAQPFSQELSFGSQRLVVLDNNVNHHYALLARLYDWKARGAQTFAVLIPQDMTPGTITVENGGPQKTDAGTFELLRVRTPDLEVELYLDATHRLVRLAVPAAKAEVHRE